jgi:hypothetical protein
MQLTLCRLSQRQLSTDLQARCHRQSPLIASRGQLHVQPRPTLSQSSSAPSRCQTRAGVQSQISKSSLDTSSSAAPQEQEPCIQRRAALALAVLGALQGTSLIQQQAANADVAAAPEAPVAAVDESTEVTHQVSRGTATSPQRAQNSV